MVQDRRLRLAIAVTVVMSIVIVVVASGRDDPLPIVVPLVLVMAALQMAVLLWGGPERTGLATARQHFLRGEFNSAAELLVAMLDDAETPDVRVLTLLGNTYRQLARLESSLDCLLQAVEMNPHDKMALYGLGRTCLVLGRYAEAVQNIEAALEHGARRAIVADLALALHYLEAEDRTLNAARQAMRVLRIEDYRILLVNYLVYNLVKDEQQRAAAKRIMLNNTTRLAYWQAQARRYASTDYGRRLAVDVMSMKALIEERATE